MSKKKVEPEAPVAVTAGDMPATKTEAIRRAIAAGQTKPKEAVAWIKEQWGINVEPQVFSTTRYMEQKREEEGRPAPIPRIVSKPVPAPVSPPAAVPTPIPAPTATAADAGMAGVDLVKSLKPLIDKYGHEAVTKMAAALK